jgi:hypothetical protein
MTTSSVNNANEELPPASVLRVGFYAALVTTVITLVTFGFAINAVPTSGANCLADCFDYPYLDTISQFPKDYIWMPLAILMILAYLVLMVSIQSYASRDRKIFGQIGLSFAIMAALILVGDYFVQFSVVPVSLMHGETEGITMLTQYNSHGPFIVLEELGYLMMTLSFLFIAPVFAGKNRLEGAIRWILIISFALAMVSLTLISINHGLNRQDRFEVIIISIDWLVLVINGILWSVLFKKQLKSESI